MKKIIRRKPKQKVETDQDTYQPWKVLVVDDEPDIHLATELALTDFTFHKRKLNLLSAHSASEAKLVLAAHNDIAMALIDVVMETDDAGLLLVRHIREELNNNLIRLIIRTGQPGKAPERTVIEQFDIDDYKEKTELTAQKLFTSIRCGIKAYRDLMAIENNKKGLEMLLDGATKLNRIKTRTEFLKGVLDQVVGLCSIGKESQVSGNNVGDSPVNAPKILVAASIDESGDLSLCCGSGAYQDVSEIPQEILDLYKIASKTSPALPAYNSQTLCLPLATAEQKIGFIYLENVGSLRDCDIHLLGVMTQQFSVAFENLQLFGKLEISNKNLYAANDHAVFMLGTASEMKDRETGNHINRIVYYTEAIAIKMGVDEDLARSYGVSSMLHDLGKLGVSGHIIRKPGKLTQEEFKVIKTHPSLALKILGDNKWFELARQIAYSHHEKWDGSGYPEGLAGEDIPFAARIVAVADVWDALLSDRPYKEPWTMENAILEIEKCGGSHFDPDVVTAFLELYADNKIQEIIEKFPSN
jgi:response regulator RpfG family c-di-GMP phosphodiesterase